MKKFPGSTPPPDERPPSPERDPDYAWPDNRPPGPTRDPDPERRSEKIIPRRMLRSKREEILYRLFIYIGRREILECDVCGGLVLDKDKHSKFHDLWHK